MSIPIHQQGNIGTVFIFTVKDQNDAVVDISTATTLEAHFRRPDRTTKMFDVSGGFVTDGTDGKFRFITTAITDLDQVGDCWMRQGFVDLPGVFTGWTEVKTFAVKGNLV